MVAGSAIRYISPATKFLKQKEVFMQYEKVKFTILRDQERRPTVTICEISANGSVGIGISIRAQMDNPVEKIGKVKARGRAVKALVRRKNSLPINRDDAYMSIQEVPKFNHDRYKSIYREVSSCN